MKNIIIDPHSKLKNSEEKFKLLFEYSPVGMAMIEHETGKFIEVNKYLLDRTGYTKEEFLNLSFWDITPREYESQEQQQMEQLNKTGRFGPNEKEYITKDKKRFPIKISGFSLINIDGKKVVWGIIEDITQRKQHDIIYEDSKQLLEYITIENSLNKILDKIVHLCELRNPNTMCSILLLDDTKEHLITGSAPNLPKFYTDAVDGVKIGENVGSCGSAAFKKQRVIVEDIDKHENWQDYLELTNKAELKSCWSEPIISSNNEVLGTFAIYSNQAKTPDQFELKLIESYANLAAKAIEKDKYTKHIKENEKKLNQLFDNAQSGLLYISSKRELLKANQRFADILGYDTPEELIGMSLEKFHLNRQRYEEFGKKNFESLKERDSFTVEYQLKKKDGTPVWCNMSAKVLDDKKPADLNKGVLWTVSDISLSKKYEKELKENELLLRTVLSTIPDMIWLKNTDGKYLICNEEFERCFGAKQSEIIGKTDFDFLENNEAQMCKTNDIKAMNKPSTTVNTEEWVTYKSDNKEVLLDITKRAMKDNNGDIIGILGIGHDVTQRKLKEDTLKELNDLAESLTKSQRVLLSLFDKGESVLFKWENKPTLKATYVSLSVEKLFGLTSNEFISKNLSYESYIDPNDRNKVKKEFNTIIENDLDYFQHESYRIITKDKNEKWVTGYTVTQKDKKGNITHFIGYITDITKHKQQQEVLFNQTKMASMGEMIGNIAHQWRQPLSVISTGATGLLIQKQYNNLSDEKFMEICEIIEKNAQYLSQTIDDFRNFIKGDNTPKIFSLKKDTHSFLKIIEPTIKSNNLNILLNICEDTKIKGFPNELIQCFMNIFNNSKDVLIELDEEDRHIFISQYKKENKVIIEFQDSGGGIDETIISKIFEPYFTTKHPSKGTGLGLNMTYNLIVNSMGGEIKAKNIEYQYKNKNYKGALFTISIPI